MSYKFGDIINCVQNNRIGHSILILGVNAGKGKILYETITSRTYRAFDNLCSFFNKYCIDEKCERGRFKRYFKDKNEIFPVDLFSVFFLDKDRYSSKLTTDSMVIINRSPRTGDIKVFDNQRKNKLIEYTISLSKDDIYRLYTHIRTSVDYIGEDNFKFIKRSFNLVK